MIQLILAMIAILASIYAIYTDLKYRYIDNWLTWGLVGIGVLGNGLLSLITWSYQPVLYSACAALIFYHTIGKIFFYTGTFGGGDIKLMTGFAAAIPQLPKELTATLGVWPFLLTLLINILLIGSICSNIYLGFRAIKNRKEFKKRFAKQFSKLKILFYICIGLFTIPIITFFFDKILAILLVILVFSCLLTVLSFAFSKSVEEIMVHFAKPSELDAGDRPINQIKVNGKLIYKPRLVGLLDTDLEILRKLEAQGKITQIKVKDGIPYAPGLCLGLVFSLFVGDIMMIAIQSML